VIDTAVLKKMNPCIPFLVYDTLVECLFRIADDAHVTERNRAQNTFSRRRSRSV